MCTLPAVAAYLPLELRITTDDGALDEVLVGQGTARPNWTPEEDEAPPPGLTNVFPLEFPDEFSGTLTVELVPGALDGWDEWSWGFGAIFGSDEEETSAHGGMSFRMHRREGEGEGVIRLAVIAEWAPHQANDETGVETDAE